jgi:hypothetical protein
MFAATKLKRPLASLWKSILHSWLSVRPGLCKSEPTNSAEIFGQPIFGNPLITNQDGRPLGLSGRSEGNAFASASCSRVGDFWDPEAEDWKGLSAFEVSFHPVNRLNRNLIIANIPWDPATDSNKSVVGDWVSKKEVDRITSPEWVYQITDITRTITNAREFKKSSNAGRIQATSSHNITIPLDGYTPVKVLAQDGHGATLRLAKEVPSPGKKPLIYWIFESGFISDLPWDPGNWHGSKRTTWATPLSLVTLLREDTGMPGGSNTLPASSPSSNN